MSAQEYNNGKKYIWNRMPTLVGSLGKFIADGFSAGIAADKLSLIAGETISRSACLMKARRLGTPFHSENNGRKSHRNGPAPGVKKVPKIHPLPRRQFSVSYYGQSPPMPPTAPEAFIASADFDATIPVQQRRTLMQLTDKTCRYPVGEPGSAEFFFCGGSTQDNPPYCSFHSNICFSGFPTHRKVPRPDFRKRA